MTWILISNNVLGSSVHCVHLLQSVDSAMHHCSDIITRQGIHQWQWITTRFTVSLRSLLWDLHQCTPLDRKDCRALIITQPRMSPVPRLIVIQQSCLWWRQWMSSYSTFLQQHQASQNKSSPGRSLLCAVCCCCCWPMPCNWSLRVVMMMMQSGLLGARLKAPPLALSPTSPRGLDLKQLPSLHFDISCFFFACQVANHR